MCNFRKFEKAITITPTAVLVAGIGLTTLFAVLFCAAFVLSYAVRYWNVTMSPDNFPNTVWSTDDENITFNVGEYL